MGKDKLDNIIAEARRNSEKRQHSYREQALNLYPWICGRCAREFNRKNLKELTVHHKDHNHDNNPADGSNWELLCVYCHEDEHSRHEEELKKSGVSMNMKPTQAKIHKPLANLDTLLKKGNPAINNGKSVQNHDDKLDP